MTTKQLIQTVALGLSLAMVSLTPAYGATGHLSAAEMKAAHKRLMAHQQSVEKQKEIQEEISEGGRTRSDSAFVALHSHHRTVGQAGPLLRLFGKDGDAVELDSEGAYIANVNGVKRPAKAADFLRHGVDSPDKLLSSIHKQVLKVAGVQGKHTDEAALKQAVAKLIQESSDAQNFVNKVATLPDIGLLEAHHNSVLVTKEISNSDVVALESGLAVRNSYLYDKNSDQPIYRRLAELGVGSTEKFEQLLGRVLVKTAGVKGDPLNPKVVERARATLRREMKEVKELENITNQDLKLLEQVHKSIAQRDKVEVLPIVLATKKLDAAKGSHVSESIEVIGGKMDLVKRRDGKIESQNRADIADLHSFGIDSKVNFQDAVGRAMKAIAPEDLATAGVTPADGANARGSAAEMKAARDRLTAYQQSVDKQKEIQEEILGSQDTADSDDAFTALRKHHEKVAQAGSLLHLFGKDGDSIEMHPQGAYIANVKGTERPAEVADFLRHGVDSREKLLNTVHEQVLKVAGVQGKHTDKSALKQAVEKLNQRVHDANNLVSEAAEFSDVQLLAEHHDEVLKAKGISGGELALEGHLTVREGALIDSKSSDKATYQRLAEIGVGSTEKFEQLLGRVLVKTAGVKGDPRNPKVVERARATLRREIKEVEELKGIITHPDAEHEGLKLLAQVHKSIAERDKVEALPIVLGTKKLAAAIGNDATESIEVIDSYSSMFDSYSSMYVVQRQAGKITSKNEATIADLHRFGLDSKAEFQQAVGRAMNAFAQEDLDK